MGQPPVLGDVVRAAAAAERLGLRVEALALARLSASSNRATNALKLLPSRPVRTGRSAPPCAYTPAVPARVA
jgi:hypothetical protein